MDSARTITPPLFSEDDLKQISPTGSPWAINPSDPATVPVPLQVVMVKVEGPYTERDRKLWTFLLHAVWDDLETKPLHDLSVAEINGVFRDLGGDHNSTWIWDSAKRLAKTTVEWEATFGDERVLGVSSIFGAVLSKSSRQSGRLKFNFPPLLIPIIKQPNRFARLRVHFMIGLSGKYAVTLYEVLEGFANRRDGLLDCSIAELRSWLKVPEGKYPDWKDFRRWVLDPALKQINAEPLGAGFEVTYEPVRAGRFYERLRFKIVKVKARSQTEVKLKHRIQIAKAIAAGKGTGRPALLDHSIEKARKATEYFLDMRAVENEFWAYWESKGRPPFTSGVEAAFVGFAKKKLRQVKYGERQEREAADIEAN
jgi:hypothetical protein